jgi:repressor LexA
MALSDNLKKARKNAGLTQEELAKKLALNSRTYGSYERGERDISTALLLNICKALNISSDTLLDTPTKPDIQSNAEPIYDNVFRRPVFDSVSAGFGAYASNDIVGYMPVIIDNPHDVDDTICIKVRGNSMYPKIEEGDTIVVRKQDAVDDGRIAVVLIGDDAVVKKVEFGKDCLTLISINPEYPPRTIEGPDLENVRIVGLVRQVIKAV